MCGCESLMPDSRADWTWRQHAFTHQPTPCSLHHSTHSIFYTHTNTHNPWYTVHSTVSPYRPRQFFYLLHNSTQTHQNWPRICCTLTFMVRSCSIQLSSGLDNIVYKHKLKTPRMLYWKKQIISQQKRHEKLVAFNIAADKHNLIAHKVEFKKHEKWIKRAVLAAPVLCVSFHLIYQLKARYQLWKCLKKYYLHITGLLWFRYC